MATIPQSVRTSLRQCLLVQARAHWPQLSDLHVRHGEQFAHVTGVLSDGTRLALFRLRYCGTGHTWGFEVYVTAMDGYQAAALPNGFSVGTPQEALDYACNLFLAA